MTMPVCLSSTWNQRPMTGLTPNTSARPGDAHPTCTHWRSASGAAPDAERQWVQVGWASPGLADVFGVSPVMGRWFHVDDKQTGIVISQGLWQRLFGGRADVVGQTMRLDTRLGTVIGVAPPGFRTLTP